MNRRGYLHTVGTGIIGTTVVSADNAAADTAQEDLHIDVGAGENGFQFAPDDVVIEAGSTVVWEWTGDGGSHNVVSDNDSADFESELTDEAGHTFTHTFEEPGTYDYVCIPHQALGMSGRIRVEPKEIGSRIDVGAGENGFQFAPDDAVIEVGSAVVWDWTGDGGAHNVVSDDDNADFESELTDEAGHIFTHTFEEPGTYDYVCIPHQAQGMSGQVTVEQQGDNGESDGEVTVAVEPSTSQVGLDEEITVDVVITDPSNGVGSYEITGSISDPAVANFTAIEETRTSGSGSASVGSDGATATADRALLDDAFASADTVTIATLTLSGEATGTTELDIDTATIGDEGGTEYTVSETQSATIEVTEGGVTIAVEPTTTQVGLDGEAAVDVVVSGADAGVGAYEITGSVGDPAVASFTAIEETRTGGSGSTSIGSDGATATADRALLDEAFASADTVTIATLTLSGEATGTTGITIDTATIGDEGGTEYTVSETQSATVEVTEGIDVTGDGTPATDTDGDGKLEDVNGDGESDVLDVQAFFENLDAEAAQNNPAAFDFNDDGDVSILDVQALFNQL